ncbi:hypothetical protein MBANPS3_005336 [Mucor bainieri]
MVIPAALAIFIYQILAIIATEAVSQIVTSIAYGRRDFDYKLMFLQSPLNLLINYKRFNQPSLQKASIVFFTCFSLALKFIPTILTRLTVSAPLYGDLATSSLNQSELASLKDWPLAMPVFDNFISYLTNPGPSSLEDMTSAYIKDNLGQNNTRNSDGQWLTPSIARRFEWDSQQQSLLYGIVDGLTVQATEVLTPGCYPVYNDRLINLVSLKEEGSSLSLLDANDTLYRSTLPPAGIQASSSFGVSIFNHNSSHMTMAIKKTAHITLMSSFTGNTTYFSDCSVGSSSRFADDFVGLPYQPVLCKLISMLESLNSSKAIQAAGIAHAKNHAVSARYTYNFYQKNQGGNVMIDYTSIHGFNVKGNLANNKEYMVAYSRNEFTERKAPAEVYEIDLSDDKIGSLLRLLDPSRINQDTVDVLVGMASMRVRWENGDYSDFLLTRAEVMDGIETPTWWIATVVIIALVSLIPQISRLVVRRIPEYADNLRNLLILTVDQSNGLGKRRNNQHVGIILSEQDNEADPKALLSVNGNLVTIADKMSSVDASLIEKETSRVAEDEKYLYMR